MADRYRVFQWHGELYDGVLDGTAQECVSYCELLINSVACKSGLITKIIITDSGDFCNFEWRYGEGIVFPTKEQIDEAKL